VDHDVDAAEVRLHLGGDARDREVAGVAVAAALLQLGRRVVERVVVGVERVDLLEAHLRAVGEGHRVGELAALEHRLEDHERGRPGADADLGAGLGQGLGDREAETAVVGDAGDQGALAGEIDAEHAAVIAHPRAAVKSAPPPSRRVSSPRTSRP
jgi:hypothetical protein